MNNLPKEFWVDRDVFFSGGICTHVSRKDEIEGGVRCYVADSKDFETMNRESLIVCLAITAVFIVINTLGILIVRCL